MKAYSVRKMGTRLGRPHYGAECAICRRVLAVAHLTKDAATSLAVRHVETAHSLPAATNALMAQTALMIKSAI